MYAFQTDTIEGWISDGDYPSMCVTITSTHSDLLGRHVPVLMSVTFGRTAKHYKAHFAVLLRGLQYNSFYDSKSGEEADMTELSTVENEKEMSVKNNSSDEEPCPANDVDEVVAAESLVKLAADTRSNTRNDTSEDSLIEATTKDKQTSQRNDSLPELVKNGDASSEVEKEEEMTPHAGDVDMDDTIDDTSEDDDNVPGLWVGHDYRDDVRSYDMNT